MVKWVNTNTEATVITMVFAMIGNNDQLVQLDSGNLSFQRFFFEYCVNDFTSKKL